MTSQTCAGWTRRAEGLVTMSYSPKVRACHAVWSRAVGCPTCHHRATDSLVPTSATCTTDSGSRVGFA